MPYPNPADLDAIKKDPNVTILEQPGLNVGYLAFHTRRSRSTTCACARRSTWRSTRRRSSTPSICRPASRPRTRSRRSMWSYNDSVKDDPFDPAAAKKLLAEAGFPNGMETDLWAMPVQRPYNPNAKRIAELMQADLAKIGVKAEIKSFEWGEYRKRAAGRRAPDGHAGLDRRQRRSGQLPAHPARLRLGASGVGFEHRQVLLQAVRRSGREGEDASAIRPSAPSSTSRRR